MLRAKSATRYYYYGVAYAMGKACLRLVGWEASLMR